MPSNSREYQRKYQRKWRAANPEKNREYIRKYRAANPERTRAQGRKDTKNFRARNPSYNGEWAKKYRAANPEKASEQNKKDLKTFREKNRNNPIYRLHQNMRTAISTVLAGRGKSAPTMKIIGCTVEELFEHFESCSTWEPWMTRETYGRGGWDVDHIIAITKWDQNCPVQFAKCWHKSNLQPMEHIENIKKGAK